MIQLRFRAWDFDDWTSVTLEGPEEAEGLNVLCSWSFRQNHEIEILDEDGAWVDAKEDEDES